MERSDEIFWYKFLSLDVMNSVDCIEVCDVNTGGVFVNKINTCITYMCGNAHMCA